MNSTLPQYISVPLDRDAHHYAEEFAAEQAAPAKGKQVYLNTLAVYAVHCYLKWLGVETHFINADSWHPGLRTLLNVADLVLPTGKLECRPVLPGESTLKIPLSVTQDRLGYVAVQFLSSLESVQLLGFLPAPTSDEPSEEEEKLGFYQHHLEQLQSLDTLIETIHAVNLRQWLEGIFHKDWQVPELVLIGNLRSIKNFRSTQKSNSTSRAKVINLADQLLVLVMQIIPQDTEKVNIRLRLYPGNDANYLPQSLQITLFDQTGTACIKTQARSDDNSMQLEFSCQVDERFSVNLMSDRISLTEKFVV